MSSTAEHEAVRRYYSDAAEDYRYWGETFNMHFGFWRWGMNPWRLEPMLERMNQEVIERITTGLRADARVLDLGCGVGTPLQWALETHKVAQAIWPLTPANRILDETYYDKVLPTLDRQLGLAGLRLTRFLTDGLGAGQCPAP